jgi:hypothetical protein
MCHSALGVPGVVTLLHNLVVTRDVSLRLPEQMKMARDARSSQETRKQLAQVSQCGFYIRPDTMLCWVPYRHALIEPSAYTFAATYLACVAPDMLDI